MEDIVKILMELDDLSHQEAQQMVEECRQRLQDEAIPTGDIELAEEILAEELGLEFDYMMDLIL